jgi:sugar phosphate isomerase/epimerase
MVNDLAVSTYTGLGRVPLPDLLRSLADAGHEQVELLAAPPHVDLDDLPATVGSLTAALRETGQRVTSVVPSGVDVNLASGQAGMRGWSRRQFIAAATLAAELGAPRVVVHPGRRHPLRPPPREELWDRVVDGLGAISAAAQELAVEVLLENVPTGLIDTADECAEVSALLPGRVGLCFDVANAFMVEDVARAIGSLAVPPALVHVSDTRRDRWLHDPLGTGDVAWDDVAAALVAGSYDGPVVLETLHEHDPGEGFDRDAGLWGACVARASGH